MANRLARSASPYLRQHQDNPIDWHEWGQEAFERASREDKPIFLSVGYSACHWCHVMAHESFEDPSIGELLDRDFVSIKVDREERPDVDDVYMTAVQLATGRGGWPMTLFLTPDREPFFAGTYFPKEDRGQYPGFRTLVRSIAEAWKTRRSDLIQSAREFSLGLAEAMARSAPVGEAALSPLLLAEAVEALHGSFDPDFGGFGTKPKFPPHSALRFLLRLLGSPVLDQVEEVQPGVAHVSREMALVTLDRMALGGLHDHVGGGFHRYSTDERWLLPHFEKMLYDNAQLLELYSFAARVEPRFAPVASGIVDWLRREMLIEGGLFASALDADSEGEEGAAYVWSVEELREAIGLDPDFEAAFGVRPEGNFEDEATGQRTGKNVLHRRDWRGEFRPQLSRLVEVRRRRTQPSLDDKAIAAWNGMAIIGLLSSGENDLAVGCATRWAAEPELPHQIARGVASGLPFLDDVAWMGLAFAEVARVTGDEEWRRRAEHLARTMVGAFSDADGAYWFTSDRHERLIGRSKPALDQSVPSPNAVAARLLLALGEAERAEQVLRANLGWMSRVPQATEALHDAALLLMEKGGVGGEPRIEVMAVVESSAGGVVRGRIVLDIPLGWHIGAGNESAENLPTDLSASRGTLVVEYPESEDGSYRGRVEFAFEWSDPSGEMRVRYQACTESACLPPRELAIRVGSS